RVSGLMGDVAKGIKSFKKGMADDDDALKPATRIEAQAPPVVIEAEKQADKTV
ncbi:MAG: twin arginine-targeting translocase, TatA/E family protein, partial [Pseudomonadota bacterium]